MSRVPGGTVELGDARRRSRRTVVLAPFLAARRTVTAGELAEGRWHGASVDDDTLPATAVRWRDAVAWCVTASLAAGLTPAYAIVDGSVRWDVTADGFRLPTEAEWVHASSGGGTGPRHGPLAEIGWSSADGLDGPRPAGQRAPNAFGLVDTIGNVWEWCWDRLDPARYGDYRLLKGGGWSDPPWSCRVGVRRGDAPDAVLEDVGLRVVRGALPAGDGGQGWSERADRERAAVSGPLPLGWTPLRD